MPVPAGTGGMDQSAIQKTVAEIGIISTLHLTGRMRELAGKVRLMGHRECGT